jgi:hypothetical protein
MPDGDLRTFIDRGFTQLGARLDDLKESQAARAAEIAARLEDHNDLDVQRHNENVNRLLDMKGTLTLIDDEVTEAAKELVAHGEQLKTLYSRRATATWILGICAGLATIIGTLHLLHVIP